MKMEQDLIQHDDKPVSTVGTIAESSEASQSIPTFLPASRDTTAYGPSLIFLTTMPFSLR